MHVSNCVWWLRRMHEPIVPSTASEKRRVLGHVIRFPNVGKSWRAKPFHIQHEALKDYRMICPRLLELRKWGLGAQMPVFSVGHTGPCQPPFTLDPKPIVTSSTVFTCQGSNFRSLSATFWVLKIYLFLSSKPQRCFMNVTPIKQEGPGHTSKFNADCLLWSMFGQLNHQNHPFESIHLNFFPSPLNQVTAQNAQWLV